MLIVHSAIIRHASDRLSDSYVHSLRDSYAALHQDRRGVPIPSNECFKQSFDLNGPSGKISTADHRGGVTCLSDGRVVGSLGSGGTCLLRQGKGVERQGDWACFPG